MIGAYQLYERVFDLARDDLQAMELLERFLAAGQEHFGAVALTRSGGDTLGRAMSALYALNGYLRKNFPDEFPAGFYPGEPQEVEDLIGELLVEIYSRRQR